MEEVRGWDDGASGSIERSYGSRLSMGETDELGGLGGKSILFYSLACRSWQILRVKIGQGFETYRGDR